MDRWAPHILLGQADVAGLPPEQADHVLAHYEHAAKSGVAPVISLRHLAESCGVPYAHLRSRCERRSFAVVGGMQVKPYRTFAISKRAGGKRVISVPSEDLLIVQRWINANILAMQPTHHRAYAYRIGRSISDCASIHLGARWLIRLDLASFFESVTERQVYRVFSAMGYPPLVSFEMARLCTRVDRVSTARKRGGKWESRRRKPVIKQYQNTQVGYLPQGAPTSPMLSNLVAREMDEDLHSLAKAYGGEYSRYSDDLYFSFARPECGRAHAIDVIARVNEIIVRRGFELNRAKTAIAGPGHRRIVLGLLVDGPRLRLSRQFRRRLEGHHRHCTVDPAAHAVRRGFESVDGLKNHYNGLVAFARSIDQDYVASLEREAIKWHE